MCSDDSKALLTDLYELTMAAAYFENSVHEPATFELFIRRFPENRSFLLAAGLEQALDYLEGLRFTDDQIGFLRRHPVFAHVKDSFFEFLSKLRFTGEVWAMPEGTPVFPLEPLLRVTAPVIEAQIVETFLLSTITFQTMIATKAIRIVQSAGGRPIVEFGSRRAHGPEAGVLAARSAYIGGCIGSSNVEAHKRYGVPSFGTLAHSFVMAYENEEQSLRDFNRIFPEHSMLLLDTYDTLAALDRVIAAGIHPGGIRLDSGDLLTLSKEARKRLDHAGLNAIKIFASGDLDETSITDLLARGAAIDMFGVGTALATSQDAPALGGVYKLVEFGGRPRVKLSRHKPSYPCRKQVFRTMNHDGILSGDIVALAEESLPGERLLRCVMQQGKRIAPSPPLDQVREHATEAVQHLPKEVRSLESPGIFSVAMSRALTELWEEESRKKSTESAKREF